MRKIFIAMLMLMNLTVFSQNSLTLTPNKYPNFVKSGTDTVGQFTLYQCRIVASILAEKPYTDSLIKVLEMNNKLFSKQIVELEKLLSNKDKEINNLNKINENFDMIKDNKDKEIELKNKEIADLTKKLKWQKIYTKSAFGLFIIGTVSSAIYFNK